jgi:hypothetical protein
MRNLLMTWSRGLPCHRRSRAMRAPKFKTLLPLAVTGFGCSQNYRFVNTWEEH